ncbi:MAG TPA: thioredoxin family protein [Candidatus Dormibacteraeota bacterium]|jgi:thioredoxin-like negative regulator of GroEL|nr:thioredoxin family protein [Candidatus Dormibacteraeota bacterium]
MVERAVVLAVAAVAIAAIVLAARWWSRRGVAALRRAPADGLWTALGASPDGRPSLVVFSTPSCTVCRSAQYPAVESVEATFGAALRVLRVDLSRQPAAAAAFKVLTAPSTALLTGDGRVGSFNHGFAPAEQLSAQLSALGALPASTR